MLLSSLEYIHHLGILANQEFHLASMTQLLGG